MIRASVIYIVDAQNRFYLSMCVIACDCLRHELNVDGSFPQSAVFYTIITQRFVNKMYLLWEKVPENNIVCCWLATLLSSALWVTLTQYFSGDI